MYPLGYVPSEIQREKEGSGSLKPRRGLLVSLQLLAICGMLLQAGRALNTRLIRCCVCQVTIKFYSGAMLEVGAIKQA